MSFNLATNGEMHWKCIPEVDRTDIAHTGTCLTRPAKVSHGKRKAKRLLNMQQQKSSDVSYVLYVYLALTGSFTWDRAWKSWIWFGLNSGKFFQPGDISNVLTITTFSAAGSYAWFLIDIITLVFPVPMSYVFLTALPALSSRRRESSTKPWVTHISKSMSIWMERHKAESSEKQQSRISRIYDTPIYA